MKVDILVYTASSEICVFQNFEVFQQLVSH